MHSGILLNRIRGGLVVSCQAPTGDPFADPASLARFAEAAVRGGAVAIRAEGPDAIRAIRQAVEVPIIGLRKRVMADGQILITPSDEDAAALVAAGADIVALDCSKRGQAHGALSRVQFIQAILKCPAWADIATVDEAVSAVKAGASAVLSTLRGYTIETTHITAFDERFIGDLVAHVAVPVLAEGRIHTPEQAASALAAGAFAVVVGAAVTRPELITQRFVQHLPPPRASAGVFIGLDLGGTQIKSGHAAADGTLRSATATPTPARLGRHALLNALTECARVQIGNATAQGLAPSAVGVATAGWVDPDNGQVLYATDNLPGWTGTELAAELENSLDLPVAVENDGNAFAIAEHRFGATRNTRNFACITLGTGVGGGVFVAGQLNRGAHHAANAIGHIIVERDGRPCTCGRRGCLEAYASADALLGYADNAWTSVADLLEAARSQEPVALRALEVHTDWLATGCITLHSLLDLECLLFSGGLTQGNPVLVSRLEKAMRNAFGPHQPVRVALSELGYFGGVLGAIAVASSDSRGRNATTSQQRGDDSRSTLRERRK